jgi:hypothetical protein
VRRSRDAAAAHPQHRPVCRGEIHLPGDGLHGGGFGACRHGQAVRRPQARSGSYQLLPRAQDHVVRDREARHHRPPPSSAAADGLDGHHVEQHHWDCDSGSVSTQTHIPVNGTIHPKFPLHGVESAHIVSPKSHHTPHFNLVRFSHGKLPKINFPVFTGEDPQLWRTRCVDYFDMYGVEPSLWAKVASMHVEGPVARWLQSVERRL